MLLSKRLWRTTALASLVGLAAAPLAVLPASASVDSTGVVINEAYLSGGSAGAAFSNKFVELYNPTDAAIDISDWSLQYRSATGEGAPSSVVDLNGTIPAKGYYLVGGGSNGNNGSPLPVPDTSLGGFDLSGASGTIILATVPTALTADQLPAGSTTGNALIVDALGYGTSNTFETAPATAPSGNTDVKSLNRTGFADTDDNASDFSLSATITPQNIASSDPSIPTDPPTDPEDPTEPTDPTEPPVEPGTVPIAEIQGTGDVSPLVGDTVTTSGIVTAVYETGGFDGYYLQTPGTGANAAGQTASDAIFVYSPSTVASVDTGAYVEITGAVSEYFGLTQVTVADANGLTTLDATTVTAPVPAAVAFPTENAARERLEGMLMAPAGNYTVTDVYSTNQYGEIGLVAATTPLVNPTVLGAPGTPAHDAAAARFGAELVTLDDGSTINFLSSANNGANKNIPVPYLSTTAPVRVGAPVTFTDPVILDYRNNNWKFQPTSHLTGDNADTVQPATFGNTRTAAPANVGGDITLATFNVLNYFATTGADRTGCTFYTDRDGNPITVNNSDAAGCGVRGAADAANLARQQAKIVNAINALDADVVSLEEIENSARVDKDRDFALGVLVDALNADAGNDVWSFVPSPEDVPENEDVIRTAYIYKADAVETVGTGRILLDSPAFSNAREPNAQAFKPAQGADSEAFIVIANHFKSKSDSGATGDNVDSGEGAYTGDRVRQAEALVAFADELTAEWGTERVFLTGDFNSYAQESPIQVLEDAGYISQGDKSGKYTYQFGKAIGSLDYIFASGEADTTVTGADVWNINSVESIALEYSRYNYNATNFYDESPYRSSDHDPVLVGIDADSTTSILNLLNINDFHGRIDANTVKFAGTIESLKAQFGADQSLFLSAGDNIGASLFASSSLLDQPTIDVLNALGLAAAAVGNHEFDQGYDDLVDRVMNGGQNARFPYLGANVYLKGTSTPALDEYAIFEVDGVDVAVIGAVTEETPTLVSPGGITDLEFGDPVEAVNRVAAQLSDGDESNGEADVIVAEFHEGAGAGIPDGSTLEEEVLAGGAFADIVSKTSAEVDAIFTGHTHKQYAWDAPVPGVSGETRPILQTGSYGENIGQIVLTVDTASGDVTSYEARNVVRVTTEDAELIATYPAVAEVDRIVRAAIAESNVIGNQVVGSATAPITTAFANGVRDDRSSESTLGNLVANSLVESLSSADRGSAEIGVVNPGGLRADLAAGDITYAQANAVLPFLNNLWTTTLDGEQFKELLEQQWQLDADGNVPSRPYLQLGLSDNVSYTFDPARTQGDRITSITVNGAPIDPAADYRIGSFSFLLQGGDNFRIFNEGVNTRDSGLVDRDAWIDYIRTNSPLSPSFDRRSVQVTGIPTGPVAEGSTLTLNLAKLDLTSAGSPVNTSVTAAIDGATVATSPVTAGEATVSFTVPDGAGEKTLTIVAQESGTTVTLPLTVTSGAPTPAPEDELTEALKDLITVIGAFVRGEDVAIQLLQEWIGKYVSIWLYSEPIMLSDGLVQVGEDGRVTVTVPEDAPLGDHRLVVLDENGDVISWTDVEVLAAAAGPGDPGEPGDGGGAAGPGRPGSLSNTGGEIAPAIAFALLLLMAGTTALIVSRRRTA
ncbi:ExeM/NucH family extracellular endonuclease [Mycetocola manganoxydans]|uniref:ExeM/NucH family extracellular endonuclease n=1 Tax=Mycetocola manganoxydans TaxID=699879 RepID=A0A3L6ZKX9_9MICO|nr:ExeM/NucH family extracellular endonuclease [Mycetocola manganoxydans]RLP68646.1 ExeM/NucH family extracellular endonuclease [Mycetocola manganoxydans]GHD45551.1 multifunctional nuclease/2',3'-cyclic-nucleotide 2'-phosphodiesterase/5'-nucleotidase/3'-nucleotidase [Mycetocola manganoxydans]